jgi:hypothetical protein
VLSVVVLFTCRVCELCQYQFKFAPSKLYYDKMVACSMTCCCAAEREEFSLAMAELH